MTSDAVDTNTENCVEDNVNGEEEENGLMIHENHHDHHATSESRVVGAEYVGEVDEDTSVREGTTSSARLNILSTMVGGGSLSLPYAFSKCGNAFLGPLLLIVMATLTEFCFRIMIQSIRILSYPPTTTVSLEMAKVGRDSFESMTAAAFGSRAKFFSSWLVTFMCFFGTVGYAVLLRDMLQPISSAFYGHDQAGPSWQNNSLLWFVVVLTTPLCTLPNLTSLQRFGAASMFSVLVLASCIVFRSLQCNFSTQPPRSDSWKQWSDSFQWGPQRWTDVLDVFPIFISCYVCHYNILTVHNELRRPTVKRVNWWLRSTTWSATVLYGIMGLAGSAFGKKCTTTGQVQPNVLLDFDNQDPLLLIGRLCLAITIALAFPMLTIPARDIALHFFFHDCSTPPPSDNALVAAEEPHLELSTTSTSLEEPLLTNETAEERERTPPPLGHFSWGRRCLASMALLWTATATASAVHSIDVVWDLLGSSLSILLSILIPTASFLIITKDVVEDSGWKHLVSRFLARTLIVVFIPLMILSTGNAVYHTFFHSQ